MSYHDILHLVQAYTLIAYHGFKGCCLVLVADSDTIVTHLDDGMTLVALAQIDRNLAIAW